MRSEQSLVHWRPSRQGGLALLTEVGMVLAYAFYGRASSSPALVILSGLVAIPLLAVVIPVYWTTVVERQPLSALGITAWHWLPSLLLGIALGAHEALPLLIGGRSDASVGRWLPMATAGGV